MQDDRIERYSPDSDSWFLAYCCCQVCRCQNNPTKVREKLEDGRLLFWCTYCYLNHRSQKP